MKALLLNPKFPISYWSFPHLCRISGRRTMAPPLGLLTVAALLPPEWDLRLVDLNIRLPEEEDWRWADLVLITGMMVQRQELLALVREAKSRGKTVVVGGPYPTSLPDEVLDAGCDFLVRGEGETAIPLLLQALQRGQAGGVFEAPEKPDLRTSPAPRYDLINPQYYITMSVQTSRGCPFDCEFCDVVSLYGRKMRYKEPEQVLAELDAIYRLGWRRDVFFCDDNFIGNPAKAKEILKKLIPWMKAHGEPFSLWTQTSINLGQDAELLDLMTQANFSTVFIGIETPDETILAATHKFQNLGHSLAESVMNVCRGGLTVLGSFIIGFDGEQPGAGPRIASLVEATGMPLAMLNLLQPLPNTRLWHRLQKEGRLQEVAGSGDFMEGKMRFIPTRPEGEVLGEFLEWWDRIYDPARFLERTYRYFLAMRPTRSALARSRGKTPNAGPPRSLPPFRERLVDIGIFLRICWRFGVLRATRRQFWRQFFEIRRLNPSRWKKYLAALSFAEDMFILRENMGKWVI